MLIENMNLHPGSKVLDMACGTGLNFKLIEKQIGNTGSITGVDNSGKTHHLARKRIRRQNWSNISLVKGDGALYHDEGGFDASICTFAIVDPRLHGDDVITVRIYL